MKAICFVLMLVTGFYGFKSCKKSFNCEGDQYVTVTTTIHDKFIGNVSDGSFGGSNSRGHIVLKPHVPNPKFYTKTVDFNTYHKLKKGDKMTIEVRRYVISEDHYDGEGFGYGLLGTLLLFLCVCFLCGLSSYEKF